MRKMKIDQGIEDNKLGEKNVRKKINEERKKKKKERKREMKANNEN